MLMKEKPTTNNKFFFYGSLRKGDYNYEIIKDKAKLLSPAILHGFSLYSLGAYPCISAVDINNNKVVGEIYNITDKNVISMVDRMELGAGYKRELLSVIDDFGKEHEVVIYTMNDYQGDDLIEHGDWIRFKEEKRNKKIEEYER